METNSELNGNNVATFINWTMILVLKQPLLIMAYSRLNKLSAEQNFINEMSFDMHVISAQWPLIYAYLWHLANDKSVRLRGTNANHTHLLQIVQMYFIHTYIYSP